MPSRRLIALKEFLRCMEEFENTQSLRRNGKFAKHLNLHVLTGAGLPADIGEIARSAIARLDLISWVIEIARDKKPGIRNRARNFARLMAREKDPFLEPLEHYLAGDSGHARSSFSSLLANKELPPEERIFAANWKRYLQNEFRTVPDMKKDSERPKLMQFWHETPPSDVAAVMGEWKNLIGDGSYILHNQNSASQYIRHKIGLAESEIFDAIWSPTPQSDTMRFVHLFFEGGFYIDADFAPCESAKAHLDAMAGQSFFMTQSSRILCATAPGFMGVERYNPVMELCLETVFEIWRDCPDLSPMIYGPYLIRWAMHHLDPVGDMEYLTCSKPYLDEHILKNYKPQYKSKTHWRHNWANHPKRVETIDWVNRP